MPNPLAEPPENLTYGAYLRLDELLSCQSPRTGAHDELLFVTIHQVYELWFKQILHEIGLMQQRLEGADSAGALATARRIGKIFKTIVGQLDVLETMTPKQFTAFRPELGESSGFQSYQFRLIEAVFGRRDFAQSSIDADLESMLSQASVFDSLLRYLRGRGWDVPDEFVDRDLRQAWQPNETIQTLLAEIYDDEACVEAAVCEALVDIDEGIQEWRYRHVKMVERIIGLKFGTGGSAGADYLRNTLFRPAFPDLWAIRSR